MGFLTGNYPKVKSFLSLHEFNTMDTEMFLNPETKLFYTPKFFWCESVNEEINRGMEKNAGRMIFFEK